MEVPGKDGQCGSQHPMATCLPMQGRTCCSTNGFCGSNETYCLEINGCQSGCVDPSEFFATTSLSPVPISSSTTFSPTTALSTTLSPSTTRSSNTLISSATTTATPTATHGLTSAQKSGAIAGGIIGGVVVLAIIGVLIFKKCVRSPRPSSPQTPMREPTNFHDGIIVDRYGSD